jgi:ABC-type lipoprotein release transport system permease subunit
MALLNRSGAAKIPAEKILLNEFRGIFPLVLKNIVRNKKNSLLIVLLIASITFLFFIGNSVIGSSDQGLRDAYIDSLTGDVVLQKISPVTMNLFGANTPVIDEFFTVPEFPAFDRVRDIALDQPGVAKVTSQVSTKAFLDMLDIRSPALICGVDPATYFDVFPSLILEAGRFLQAGEYGAMITAERAQQIADGSGTYPTIGSPLLLTAGGAVGFKIRELPLVGIYRYKNSGPLMSEIVITDPQTARILASIQVASSNAETGEETLGLLDAPIEDLFGEIPESGGPDASLENIQTPGIQMSNSQGPDFLDDTGGLSPDSLATYLGSFTGNEPEILFGGDWNFIILRLEKGVSAGRVIASLNKKINPMGAVAVNWRIAAGNSAILLFLIQALFNGGIFLMSAAGIIAAVNILLISVFKRTSEIGTLRAIGAGDGYIRGLVLGENFLLSCTAGCLGVLAGFWTVCAVNRAGIPIPNDLIASLLGGGVLSLRVIPSVAASSFGVALILGLAASVFPVETAVRIDPVVAVRQG